MHAYDLVSETIRKQIKLGKYQPGMKLPKEIELADRMGVSRKTLRTALEELEAAGLIMRVRQGVGEPNRIYVLIPGKEDAALA